MPEPRLSSEDRVNFKLCLSGAAAYFSCNEADAHSMKPLVLLTADTADMSLFGWPAVPLRYAEALLRASDVVPLTLPNLGPTFDIDGVLSEVDGVLATGWRPPTTGPASPPAVSAGERTVPFLPRALAHGVPLLALCRGFDELNVALGGRSNSTPETPSRRVRPSGDRHLLLESGSRLAGLLGARRVPVRGLRRRPIERLAERLAVEGRAVDGTVCAARVRDAAAFAFALQWQAEIGAARHPASRALFEAFGQACRRRYAARRSIAGLFGAVPTTRPAPLAPPS